MVCAPMQFNITFDDTHSYYTVLADYIQGRRMRCNGTSIKSLHA